VTQFNNVELEAIGMMAEEQIEYMDRQDGWNTAEATAYTVFQGISLKVHQELNHKEQIAEVAAVADKTLQA
jgi:broad-specificity NMP kinase